VGQNCPFFRCSLEDIYEEEIAAVVVNNDHPVFNDRSAGAITNQNNYDNIPGAIIENLQGYIALLKEENERLKEESKGSQSPSKSKEIKIECRTVTIFISLISMYG
jgi:hypothetical protein